MPSSDAVVSILIPNFNNGRESSRSGTRDFLGDLLTSLLDTLVDDPTPVEIIVVDDGSTDDSLETGRAWAGRQWGGWRGDQPFCRLIELDHGGVLSVVANRLMDEATGDICCRLDGDIVVHTKRWAAELVRIFRTGPPDLGVVGPCQIASNGFLHAAGDWILHPRGYHHIAQGITPDAVPHAAEVDHVMGCFYCMRRFVWEKVGRYDETILRGQTVDYGLRARVAGFRCFFVPTFRYTHYHEDRLGRSNVADTNAGKTDALTRFREKWGFDRLAPDLDAVALRYAGTALLWNARVFGPSMPWPPLGGGPRAIETTHWGAFGRDDDARRWIEGRVELARQAVSAGADDARVVQIGCGDGLVCHLLATAGVNCTGIERDPSLLDVARAMTAKAEYPGSRPTFTAWSDLARLPIDDASADVVLLLDTIESHPNPVGLLAQTHQVLAPGGSLVILTRQRPNPLDAEIDHLHRYRAHELNGQVRNCRHFEVVREAEAAGEMLVLTARRRSATPSDSSSSADRVAIAVA